MKLITFYKAQKTKRGAFITAMKDRNLGKLNKRSDGLPFPSSEASITSDASTAVGSNLSDLRPLNANIIASNTQNVNYCSF